MYYVYILTNSTNTTLYIGVTNNLARRVYQHKMKLFPGFTKKYNLYKLIYVEETDDISVAIGREKQLKGWSRKKKEALIGKLNPAWLDLGLNLFDQ